MADETVSKPVRDETSLYRCEGDPASTDWVGWSFQTDARFNGQYGRLLTRRDGDSVIVRMQPHHALTNLSNRVHGGAVAGFVDVALFVGGRAMLGDAMRGAVTVDLSVQFAGAADVERPIDAHVELTRETGRMVFLRGSIRQADDMVASFIGLLRKSVR